MLGAQIDERVDRRVRERARRIRLDGDARSEEMPAAAEALERLVEGPSAAEGRGIALATLEDGVGRGHALTRELGGENPVPRRVAGVIGLRHRAEILLEPGGVGGGDGERVARLDEVEPHDARRRGGAAERADRGGRVPAARIVVRVQRRAEGHVDLEAEDVSEDQRAPAGHLGLRRGQSRRQERHARMTEQREVRVVEVVRVPGGAVGQRGPARRGLERGPDDGRERDAALGADDPPHDVRHGLAGAREHDAERVERGATDPRHRLGRAVLERRLDDELGEAGGGAHERHDIMSAGMRSS